MTNDPESKFTTLKAFMTEAAILTAAPDNKDANSGVQAYKDIIRSTFTINRKEISKKVVKQLYAKHGSLNPEIVELEESKNEDYRSFAKEIFKEMFIRAKAPIPTSSILDEMVTNCNQTGHELMHHKLGLEFCSKYYLACSVASSKIEIECKSPKSVSLCINSIMAIKDPYSHMKCSMPFSVKFTLESDQEKINYKDIEMSVILPEKLERHVGDQAHESLVNTIREFLYELFEMIFSRRKVIEKDDTIKVTKRGSKIEITSKSNSISEDIQTPINDVKIDKLQKTVQQQK